MTIPSSTIGEPAFYLPTWHARDTGYSLNPLAEIFSNASIRDNFSIVPGQSENVPVYRILISSRFLLHRSRKEIQRLFQIGVSAPRRADPNESIDVWEMRMSNRLIRCSVYWQRVFQSHGGRGNSLSGTCPTVVEEHSAIGDGNCRIALHENRHRRDDWLTTPIQAV